MVSTSLKLAKHLHDTNHQAETWDTCSPACKKFYMQVADSTMVFLQDYVQGKEKAAFLRGRLKNNGDTR